MGFYLKIKEEAHNIFQNIIDTLDFQPGKGWTKTLIPSPASIYWQEKLANFATNLIKQPPTSGSFSASLGLIIN
jgi:hypothetical protein